MSTPDILALLTAVKPIAAYAARTPPPNRLADNCATLVNTVADLVDVIEQAAEARVAEPDWQALFYRVVASLDFPASTHPLVRRRRQLLANARATLPLAQHLFLASITSHHLTSADPTT